MYNQLLCHLIGDYWLQNDWMALNKKQKWMPAIIHGLIYTIPFIFVTRSILALFVICLTHIIIDHTDIVCRLNQIKNWNFKEYILHYFKQTGTGYVTRTTMPIKDGYGKDRPIWLRMWLIIIQDNTLHLLINYLSIMYL